GAGAERAPPPELEPPPELPPDVAWPPPDPPPLDPLPLDPPPRLCWAYAIGEKANTRAADVKIARHVSLRSGKVRVIALLLEVQTATALPSRLSSLYGVFAAAASGGWSSCPATSPRRPV